MWCTPWAARMPTTAACLPRPGGAPLPSKDFVFGTPVCGIAFVDHQKLQRYAYNGAMKL